MDKMPHLESIQTILTSTSLLIVLVCNLQKEASISFKFPILEQSWKGGTPLAPIPNLFPLVYYQWVFCNAYCKQHQNKLLDFTIFPLPTMNQDLLLTTFHMFLIAFHNPILELIPHTPWAPSSLSFPKLSISDLLPKGNLLVAYLREWKDF